MKAIFLSLSVWCIAMPIGAKAQCGVPTPPTYIACASSGQTGLTAGTTVNYSDTYYYNGGAATFTGVSVNYGGTLLICGSLTLTSPAMNGGTIVVEPGGALTINDAPTGSPGSIQAEIVNYGSLTLIAPTTSSVISFNISFWNYGLMNVLGSVAFTSGGMYNAIATAAMTISGDITTNVPSVNNGTLTDQGEFIFTSGLCLGGGSQTSADSLYDQTSADAVTFAASAAGTTAAIGITNNFSTNGQALTSSGDISLCEAPGEVNSIYSDAGNPGSATVNPNCAFGTLPVTLISFTASTGNTDTSLLQWSIEPQTDLVDFALEYSLDAVTYYPLTNVPVQQVQSNYAYTTALRGNTWFRLRLVNGNGSYTYSGVVAANYLEDPGARAYILQIQPNLITDNSVEVLGNMYTGESGEWLVMDAMGRTIFRQAGQLVAGTSRTTLPLPPIASGVYELLFLGNQVKLSPVSFVVIR